MFRGRIDIRADASDHALGSFQTRHSEVSNLYDLAVGAQQKILRFDVTMNHSTPMRVSQAGANLLEIKQSLFDA